MKVVDLAGDAIFTSDDCVSFDFTRIMKVREQKYVLINAGEEAHIQI